MNKNYIMQKLASIADDLDQNGYKMEADTVDSIMTRISNIDDLGDSFDDQMREHHDVKREEKYRAQLIDYLKGQGANINNDMSTQELLNMYNTIQEIEGEPLSGINIDDPRNNPGFASNIDLSDVQIPDLIDYIYPKDDSLG